MKQRELGNTGLHVSEVGMGCWELSGVSRGGGLGYGSQDDGESVSLIRHAIETGVTFFDTSDAYGLGHSEVIVGRALKASGHAAARTDGGRSAKQLIVATKVGNNFNVQPWQKDFSMRYIENAVENSMQRLGIEQIDLYQLHNPSLEVLESGEVFPVLDRLKQDGKIRFYGVSIVTPEEGRAALAKAPDLTSIMCPFNIIEQENAAYFSAAQERGVAIIARSPLASGRLAGTFTRDTVFPEGDMRAGFGEQWLQDAVAIAERLQFLLHDDTRTLAQAALKFILAHDAITTVIPGPKTVKELEENISVSGSDPMPATDVAQIRRLFSEGALKSSPSRTQAVQSRPKKV